VSQPKLKLGAVVPIVIVFSLLAAVEFLYFPGRSRQTQVRALEMKAAAVSGLVR